MLEPEGRALLLDTLRPPAGMTVDRAVATTFSLDLEALLMAPVTFALFDTRLAESGEPASLDPLSLLEAVRRHADRIDIFCQAGEIALPDAYQPIVSYLEDSIHPSVPPSAHHIFHPKVWVIRFVNPDRSDTSYRLLVLSRNLTFDQSWDTVVQLDGVPTPQVIPTNEPLAEFVTGVAELAIRALPAQRRNAVAELANDLRWVAWDKPDGVSEITFHPSGLGDAHLPMVDNADRLVVVSPFLSVRTVAQLSESAADAVLVSRPESLDGIPLDILELFDEVLQLATESYESELGAPASSEILAESAGRTATGLHVKLFAADRGWNTTIFTGSANATDAGFGGNVELLVGLSGRRSRIGVKEMLGSDSEPSDLRSMLVDYWREERQPLETTEEEKIAYELGRMGRQVASIIFTATIEEETGETEAYRMRLTADEVLPSLPKMSLRCWPITLKPEAAAVGIRPGDPLNVSFPALSLTALTSFFCVELTHSDPRVVHQVVVNARLVGAPEDRHHRVLTAQLQSKRDVIRYLLLLLADVGDVTASELAATLSTSSNGTDRVSMPKVPLFETMVKALARQPESLDHINRLIVDLQATEEGRRILPDGLDDLWPAIWQSREQLRR